MLRVYFKYDPVLTHEYAHCGETRARRGREK
jgi:hypothetical protein